jgi:hypothetical protein
VPVANRIMPVIGGIAGLTMSVAAGFAQDVGDTPDFPTTAFADGARSATVTVADVTATVRVERGATADPDNDKVWLTVTVAGRKVAEASAPDAGFDVPEAEASIAEIDPTNGRPEVYFMAYTGGAHCCSEVIVAEEHGDKWVTVPIGEFDGDGGFLQDRDGDGLAEIAGVDNRFLYAFGCYACSAPPQMIFTVRDGMALDVSADPRYREVQREWVQQLEDLVDPPDRWKSQGFIAGWVAARIRVGEGAAAWSEFLARWDARHDPGEETCLTGADVDNCPRNQKKVLKFPERLKIFLDRNGYRF